MAEHEHIDIKEARHQLEMSLSEFADLHGVSPLAVRRWEWAKESKQHREPSGSALAFTQALLDGYRPAGWEGK